MNELLNILNKIKFWQLTFLVAVILLGLGFTGGAILFDTQVLEGKENSAIYGGFGTLLLSIVLRFIPPPERKRVAREHAAVTPAQAALGARFTEWTSFETATGHLTPDHKLTAAQAKRKIVELRIKLAIQQGVLKQRVTTDGTHEIRYNYKPDWSDT